MTLPPCGQPGESQMYGLVTLPAMRRRLASDAQVA
jgi:hypothetical protein